MHVLLIVSAKRYTGAAAVAEHLTRALHSAGTSAELLFLGGDNLQSRLAGQPWAKPLLQRERTPGRAWHNLRAIRQLSARADTVICHLPHDHMLCRVAGVQQHSVLVRNMRHPRHLRSDPYHRWVHRGASGLLLAYSALRHNLAALGASDLPATTVPVPLENRFRPGLDGSGWRQQLGIPQIAPLVGMVGKMARGRGFELAVDAISHMVAQPPPHLLLVGHGELQEAITARARAAGLGNRVHCAGYQERGLPELYAEMSLLLVPAGGSDYGHRVVSEAQGCGTPVVACPLPGIEDLISDGLTGVIVAAAPEAIATAIDELLAAPALRQRLSARGLEAVVDRRLEPAGRRLAEFLHTLLKQPARTVR